VWQTAIAIGSYKVELFTERKTAETLRQHSPASSLSTAVRLHRFLRSPLYRTSAAATRAVSLRPSPHRARSAVRSALAPLLMLPARPRADGRTGGREASSGSRPVSGSTDDQASASVRPRFRPVSECSAVVDVGLPRRPRVRCVCCCRR